MSKLSIRKLFSVTMALVLLSLTAVLVPAGTVLADPPPNPYTKLAAPILEGDLPTNTGTGVVFCDTSTYMAVTQFGDVIIYKRDGDTFIKLDPQPPDKPTSPQHRSGAFSTGAAYFATGDAWSPNRAVIYKRDDDTFTRLYPDVQPASTTRAVHFSPDSNYLAYATDSEESIIIYKRDGDDFNKLVGQPADMPPSSSAVRAIRFSNDSQYLAEGGPVGGSEPLYIYRIDEGDVFTRLESPADVMPGSHVYDIAFSPDGKYMALAQSNNSPAQIMIYGRDGDNFTMLTPAPGGGHLTVAGTPSGVAFSHDSKYLAATSNSLPYVTVWEIGEGGTFTKLADVADTPAGSGQAVAFSHDSTYMAVAHSTTPYVTIYKGTFPPTVVGAETNEEGTVITIEFSKAMADPDGKHDQFAYQVNGGADQSFSAAELDADTTKINLTVDGTAIAHGDIVTVSYTAGDVEAEDGGLLASFTDKPVTNNVPVPPGSVIGTFDINQAPVVDLVNLVPPSLTPQVEYSVTVTVSDADTLDDLSTVVLKLWYDGDGGDPSEGEFDAAAPDARTAAVITWTKGSGFALSAGDPTSWALGDCTAPTLSETSGDFTFVFTVGKVATEASGAARWQVAAKATDSADQTGFGFDEEGAAMNWYGGITVPADTTVDWGTLPAGLDFEDPLAQQPVDATINYISNGTFDMQVRSAASWSGDTHTAVLDPTGATGEAQEFALKANDTDAYETAELVGTSPITIGTDTQTGEDGLDVGTMNLWIKLASSFQYDVYSGAITYSIVNQ